MGEEQKTIWCGNLSDKVTEAILYELFLQAGPLQRVTIPTDRDGRQRSFAFITYKDECSVPYALSLFEDTKLFNKALTLSVKGGKAVDSSDRGVNGMNYNDGRHLDARHFDPRHVNVRHLDSPQMQCKDETVDFNMLMQLGQQFMSPGMSLGLPFPPMLSMNTMPMYASQLGTQNYLGGAMVLNGAHSFQHLRNHPYASPGKGSPGANHGLDGYRNIGNTKNYHHSGRY